ncbi:hypothetical protein [Dokdonia sp. MED134]|uniref:hypothetical protein n=1 Tax=Dokdonia sp. MED134 TaxID=313590 RepID=UPI000A75BB85|nr:hypothetical protein [Dokdonia sp. MED134]
MLIIMIQLFRYTLSRKRNNTPHSHYTNKKFQPDSVNQYFLPKTISGLKFL